MNIFVGNLSYDLTEDALRQAFAQFGDVASARIIKDNMTGRSKGFGFVEMPNSDQAQVAIQKLNGTELSGRPVTVNEARPKPEGGEGGGFRGGRGGGGGGGRGGGFGGGGRRGDRF